MAAKKQVPSVTPRKQLAAIVAEKTGSSNAAAYEALGDVLDHIVKITKKEGRFSLPGFGTFSVVKRAARNGVNPKTGAALKIKASKSLRFKAAAGLRKL